MSSFSLSAKPNTDIWKKPPSHDVFTAPYRPHSSGPLNTFSSATLTFTTPYTHQFDQAGLLLLLTHPSHPRKWIKAGLELFDSRPRLSTVCCDAWADWSVATPQHPDEIAAGKRSVTISIQRQGETVWVYALEDGGKTPLREIAWVFGHGDGWELEVSAAVARPGDKTSDELEVQFEKFEVEWKKEA